MIKIFEKISVTSTRTHGRSEEAQLSSRWISIGSELSSLNFNSSVRAGQSFAIRYANVVIKSLCSNLDVCLKYYVNAYTFGHGILFTAFDRTPRPKVKDAFLNRSFRSSSNSFFRKWGARMHLTTL